MKVRITPAGGYAHGHIETVLIQIGITPPPRQPDGVVEMELSQSQLDTFRLRGGAHRVDIVPDEPVPVVVPSDPAPAATEEVPQHKTKAEAKAEGKK